jgi:hypothetical protein
MNKSHTGNDSSEGRSAAYYAGALDALTNLRDEWIASDRIRTIGPGARDVLDRHLHAAGERLRAALSGPGDD